MSARETSSLGGWSGFKQLQKNAQVSSTRVPSNAGYFALLSLLTIFHFWFATAAPPAEDELYYWTWAKNLQWSYFDHPPMVAWIIAFTTKIFGDNLFGIRVGACLLSFGVFAGLAALFEIGSPILLWLLLTPIFFIGGILMTPDTPLLFFFTLYALWLSSTNESFSGWSGDPLTRVYYSSPVQPLRWIIGGVILGLGLLSKYSMFLAIPCAFLALAVKYRWRAWLPGFALHLAVALFLCLPIFLFNREYGFEPLAWQWQHAMGGAAPDGHFWSWFGSQLLLFGALPFLMLPWVLASASGTFDHPRLHIAFWLYVPLLFFFTVKAMFGLVEGNWSLMAYVGFWPLAGWLLHRSSFKGFGTALIVASFALPIAASFLVILHLVRPLAFLEPQRDRLSKLRAMYELSEKVGADAKGTIVFAPTYQWVSYLRYFQVNAQQIFPEGRGSNFTPEARDICTLKEVTIFEEVSHPPPALKCFKDRRTIKQYPLNVRGSTPETYQLARYSTGRGGK